MKTYPVLLFLFIPALSFAQSVKESGDTGKTQFVLFDVEFTYTKADADNSTPSKSHYYVTGDKLKAGDTEELDVTRRLSEWHRTHSHRSKR